MTQDGPFFSRVAKDPTTEARAGFLRTAHGVVPTPVFMPVGTQGALKAVTRRQLLNDIDPPIILGNTYHLYLRPGLETLEAAGGLHGFAGWPRPILTDSGGYQVYSLATSRKLQKDGVVFQSHLDGSRHLFTPHNVVDKQRSIGSDILMVLDECPPATCSFDYAARSLRLTHEWARQARQYFRQTEPRYGYRQAQFGIVQGGVYKGLRRDSARYIADLDFEGNAIGGLAVGEPNAVMYDVAEWVCRFLPEDKPRYLMGVGTPVDLLEAIARGVDMFDCVMPTRNARHGYLFYLDGIRNFRNAKYARDFSPVDPDSPNEFDQSYTKAYLRHLLMSAEMLGFTIASVHNLAFYQRLMRAARTRILAGDFGPWKAGMVRRLGQRL